MRWNRWKICHVQLHQQHQKNKEPMREMMPLSLAYALFLAKGIEVDCFLIVQNTTKNPEGLMREEQVTTHSYFVLYFKCLLTLGIKSISLVGFCGPGSLAIYLFW